ncbi:MAG: PKD domain-containing protein [Acidobacteria bacterium]|nr:PKD domain-containing protein [Acidobacteriota bacterium]
MSLLRNARFVFAVLSAVTVAACTVDETSAPALAGPSEMALALHLQAVPDAILQDGVSQSSIQIEAMDHNGRPVRALAMRLDVTVDGMPIDFGVLSAKTVVTGDDGRARVTYTAPPRPRESTGLGTEVTIVAMPIGNDFRGQTGRRVDIRLIPPGVILPPNGAPVPAFTVTPTPITAFIAATFDASGTTDEGVVCGARCSYAWTFGDGGTASGIVATHEFRAPGSYSVRLTVTDERGQSVVVAQAVTVAASTPPTANFVFSPSSPLPGQVIFFNASASRASQGRRIVSYSWDFGSGRTDQGVTVSKGYNTPGAYVVTLVVTDDANQEGVISQTVNVGVATATSTGGPR